MMESVHTAQPIRRRNGADRAAGAFVLILMAAGCLLLWGGIPAGWLWAAGQITAEPAEHILLSVAGCPLVMIAWAQFLFWLNRLYLRIAWPALAEAAEDEGDDEPPWMRGPLEPLLVGSLLIALAAMGFWFFVFAENPGAWIF